MQIEITRQECTALWLSIRAYSKDHMEMMDSIRAANRTLGLPEEQGLADDIEEQLWIDALVEKLGHA